MSQDNGDRDRNNLHVAVRNGTINPQVLMRHGGVTGETSLCRHPAVSSECCRIHKIAGRNGSKLLAAVVQVSASQARRKLRDDFLPEFRKRNVLLQGERSVKKIEID